MKIGIICAGDREFAPFLKHMKQCVISHRAMLEIHEGMIGECRVAALFSGVCKVNAAIAAQILIDCYGAEVVINAGTAGGVAPEVSLFDVVISTEAVYHDVDKHILTGFHPWMQQECFLSDITLIEWTRAAVEKMYPDYRVWWGRTATGENFVDDDARYELITRFAPLSADMETASIAHVCYVNRIPFISIRCITDDAKHSGTVHFEMNCDTAAEIAKNVTLALLKEMESRIEIEQNLKA